MKLVTQTELAKIIGISRQSISKAVKAGLLRKSGEGRNAKIDLHDVLTDRYISDNSPSRLTSKITKGTPKKGKKKSTPKKDKTVKVRTTPLPDEPEDPEIIHSAKLRDAKIQAELTKLQIENAKKMGELISRKVVEKSFDKLSTVLLNYFHPIGDRLSPKIAGIFESVDAEKTNDVKALLNKEIMRALDGFKNTSSQVIIDWRKDYKRELIQELPLDEE